MTINPDTRVYLISDHTKRGTVLSKQWHDFECEYWVQWDDGSRELHTVLTIARIPRNHRRK